MVMHIPDCLTHSEKVRPCSSDKPRKLRLTTWIMLRQKRYLNIWVMKGQMSPPYSQVLLTTPINLSIHKYLTPRSSVLLKKLTGQLVQKSPCILWNPKFHYFVQNSLPHVPNLRQKNPVYTLPFYFFNIHFNIIPPFTPVFQVVSFKPGTSRHFFSSHACNKPQPCH